MPTPILATKLYIPSPRPKVVIRSRLIDRLSEGLSLGCKLTLISAPAGFGETTLVSEPGACAMTAQCASIETLKRLYLDDIQSVKMLGVDQELE
jgi:ATP/maltotriose-dependent transcriptional regulator MalT